MISKRALQRGFILFATLTTGLASILAVVAPAKPALAAIVTQNIASSSTTNPNIQTRWYTLRGYGNIPKSEVNWPLRSEGCPSNGVTYKVAPWQPQYDPTYSGNNINKSSNCADRYSDAGTTTDNGAWIHADAQSGWSQPGTQTTNWHTGAYASTSNVMGGCTDGHSLLGGNAPSIWGASSVDLSDQYYTTGAIGTIAGTAKGLYYDQYPAGSSDPTKVYSNGVTLVRHTFTLTSDDIVRIGQATTHLYLQAFADDWLKVYLNGVEVPSGVGGAVTTSTTSEAQVDLTAVRSYLQAGDNVLGIMVADKAIASTSDPGSRQAGVCYNLQYQYDDTQTPFNLQPVVTPVITEHGTVITGTQAQPGDTISFTYGMTNTAPGNSDSVACTIYPNTYTNGPHTIPPGYDKGTGASAPGCPRTFPGSSTTSIAAPAGDSVTAVAGQTICRSLFVNPSTRGGVEQGNEACVAVVSLPYVKVFGGDTLAGAAFSGVSGSTCTNPNDSNAQIVAWNDEGVASPYNYAGAGAQYAALALNKIIDFASNQNGAGGGAPKSLAFANTGASGSVFGGTFGAMNSCILDYYDTPPATSATSISGAVNVSSLTGGAYSAPGNLELDAGNINPNTRIQIYVNGDLYLAKNGSKTDISYAGSWSVASMPLLEVIVKGDIYIQNSMTSLDGIYIAQPKTSSTGGTIYTCATGQGAAVAPSDTNFYNSCNTKLTINGSLVANQLQLLRTSGSLNQSSTGDTATSNAAAESINYNPAMWIAQPGGSTTATYDSITSLPPIL